MQELRYYVWSNPFFRGKADANKVAEELEEIESKHGDELKPSDVVEYAKDSSTELHKLFTWDDKKAAQLQREHTARTISNSIRLRVETVYEEPKEYRLYVRPPSASGYVKIDRVAKNPKQSIEIYLKAIKDLESWLDRHSEIVTKMPHIETHIDRLVEELRMAIKGIQHQEAAE